jgi:hypothetical protein
MAIDVKDPAAAAAKFTQRGAAAAGDYATGVRGAGNRWQANAAASEENYAAAVTEAIGRKAFGRGVTKAGGAKFEAKASTVGARRFPEGIRDAGPAFQDGVAPFLQTIAALSLPPRRPKGDPANIERVRVITEALRRRKVGG